MSQWWRWKVLLWLAVGGVVLFTGCSQGTHRVGPEDAVVIVAPPNGWMVPLGQTVMVSVHYRMQDPSAEGTLLISGPQGEERISLSFTEVMGGYQEAQYPWLPPQPGDYTLRAWVYGHTSQEVHIRITGEATRPPQTTSLPPQKTPVVPTPTRTTTPTTAYTPTVTPTQLPCLMAKFVADVTIPDGTEMQPGQTFTKTWRLQNVGSCPWTQGFGVVFDSGDAMGAPSFTPISSVPVQPGQMVDVSVDLQAPQDAGTYRGNFKLRSADGQIFGLGEKHKPFYVEIVVPEPTPVALPDLVVTSIQFQPDPMVIGQDLIVRVTVANQGSASAGPFGLVWLATPQARVSTCSWNISGLAAGQSYTVQCIFPKEQNYRVPGEVQTVAIVDVSSQVAESNENNNRYQRSLTIVSGDTQGPVFKAYSSSSEIQWPPGCSAQEVTITVRASDPSGVAWVKLQYRVVQGKRIGKWITKDLTMVSSNRYETVLTAKELELSLNPPLVGTTKAAVEYYIIAADRLGNTSKQQQPSLALYYCIR